MVYISWYSVNLAGTVLLVFSLPTPIKSNPKEVSITEAPPWELFYERVIKEREPIIIFALILLIIGTACQIFGLLLE